MNKTRLCSDLYLFYLIGTVPSPSCQISISILDYTFHPYYLFSLSHTSYLYSSKKKKLVVNAKISSSFT